MIQGISHDLTHYIARRNHVNGIFRVLSRRQRILASEEHQKAPPLNDLVHLRAAEICSRVYLYYISVGEYVADPDAFSIIACALSPDPSIFELTKEDAMYLTAQLTDGRTLLDDEGVRRRMRGIRLLRVDSSNVQSIE